MTASENVIVKMTASMDGSIKRNLSVGVLLVHTDQTQKIELKLFTTACLVMISD
jgi:hypothetical protein